MIKNKQLKSRAFTLIEILIASTIFAVLLIMATAVVGRSANYQGKLTNIRSTSEDAQNLSDMITRDVRAANTSLSVTAFPPIISRGNSFQTPSTFNYKNGIALLNCDFSSSDCTPVFISLPSGNNPNKYIANTLMIKIKNTSGTELKVYYFDSAKKQVDYFDQSNITEPINLAFASSFFNSNSFQAIYNSNDLALNFGGYCPDDASLKLPTAITSNLIQQPYVSFTVTSTAKNTVVGQNDTATIQSTVTSRSYNP